MSDDQSPGVRFADIQSESEEDDPAATFAAATARGAARAAGETPPIGRGARDRRAERSAERRADRENAADPQGESLGGTERLFDREGPSYYGGPEGLHIFLDP